MYVLQNSILKGVKVYTFQALEVKTKCQRNIFFYNIFSIISIEVKNRTYTA